MSKHVLITRPREDAENLFADVASLELEPFIEPLLSIRPLPVLLPDLNIYDGLVFTSANAVRVFSALSGERNMAVYTVGDHTAVMASKVGFSDVKSAGGDIVALNAYLENEARMKSILHLSGEDIAAPVAVSGVIVERLPVYKAEKVKALSVQCLEMLDNKSFGAALFFSARTAGHFCDLLENCGRTSAVSSIKALCISDSVVKSLQKLSWLDVQAASHPDRQSMLNLLQDIMAAEQVQR